MGTWVPLADFTVCASIFTDDILVQAADKSHSLLKRMMEAAVEEKFDGWVAGMYVGFNTSLGQVTLAGDPWYKMWDGYKTALLCYACTMSGECKTRGLSAPALDPRWGYDLTFSELVAWQRRLNEFWPGAQRVLPTWLANDVLGSRHRAALAARDSKFFTLWG